MPRLFDPATQDRPIPRPASGIVNVDVRGPSPAVGQGISALGRGISEFEHDRKTEQDRIDTLRAEEAFTKLREKQLDLSYGPEGFANVKGSAAVSRPLMTEWGKKFDDTENVIAGTLATDGQRQKFKARGDVARLQYKEEILRHQALEGDTFATEVFKGTLITEQRNAAARWDSPNDIGLSLERAKAAVDARADRFNWPDEYRNGVLQQEQGKIHAAVVGQAIATGSFRYAEQWYKDHNKPGDIDSITSERLAKAVENGTQKEITNTYNTQYLANENSHPALEGLRKQVLGDQTLNDDRKNMLVGRIQNRQSVLERRGEIEQDRRLRIIGRGVTELNANTLAGFESKPEQFAPLLDAAKGTELEPEVRRAMALADATRSFRTSPPLIQEQTLARAEAGIRVEPAKFDRNVVTAWRSIYDAQRAQVNASPISFAVQQGIIQPPEPLDLSKPEESAAAMHDRFSIARSMVQRYQAPFKPLTPAETRLLGTALQDATVSQKSAYFGQLARAAGADGEGYMAIMSQLAPDDPVTAIAGSQAGRGRKSESELILRGQSILRPATKSDGKPDGSGLLPMPPETDMRARFDSTIREAFSGKAEARNAHYQAARAVYAALSVDTGDKDTKNLNHDRWDQAIEVAIGRVEKHAGRQIVLPYGVEYSSFKDGLKDRINQAVAGGQLDPSWTASRLLDLPLENVGDGRYVLRSGDGVVTTLPRYEKPVIRNPDGSVSTERTITVEADGKHFLVPTIVNGKEVSKDEAVNLWQAGKNKAVGEFSTAQDAERAAIARSASIGRILAPQPLIINFNTMMAAPTEPVDPIVAGTRDRWIKETGGKMYPGETQEQAIRRFEQAGSQNEPVPPQKPLAEKVKSAVSLTTKAAKSGLGTFQDVLWGNKKP